MIEVVGSDEGKVSPSETANVRAIITHTSPLTSVEWSTAKGYGYRTKDLTDVNNIWGPIQTAILGPQKTISQFFLRPGVYIQNKCFQTCSVVSLKSHSFNTVFEGLKGWLKRHDNESLYERNQKPENLF